MSSFTIVAIAIIAVVVIWLVAIYNRLVRLKNQVNNSWSQIDVQLQRRYDLIPNLVESVKGYMDFEKSTLEAVITSRNRASQLRQSVAEHGGAAGAPEVKELIGAETALQGSMTRFFALAESYPQLRASENMRQLQEELSSTENKIAFARQAYNDQVLFYNSYQQQLPNALFASTFGHREATLFVTESDDVKKGVKVKFS